jgi:glutamyl-tRNA synthetase
MVNSQGSMISQPLISFIREAAAAPVCRVRLAPTPSGFLHAGNALNFIFNALCARVHPQGEVLLRIDDLDTDRKKPAYVTDIFDTLDWLGIGWDCGPSDAADFEKNWSQVQFLADINPGLEAMASQNAVFACNKSRKDLVSLGGDYPDEFRKQGITLYEPDVAWRADTPPLFPLPCFIVRRRDGIPSYQTASVGLDTKFGITHIIRGEDLRSSSAAQYWLAEKAGWLSFRNIRNYRSQQEQPRCGKSIREMKVRHLFFNKRQNG